MQVSDSCSRPAGPNALFNDEFIFELDASASQLSIEVYDRQQDSSGKGSGLGDFVATSRLPTAVLMDSVVPIDRWAPLLGPDGEAAGRIRLITRFVRAVGGQRGAWGTREICLRVKAPSGLTSELRVASNSTVEQLGRLVEQTVGIPYRVQLLLLGTTALDEPQGTLQQYGLLGGELLHLTVLDSKWMATDQDEVAVGARGLKRGLEHVARLIEARGRLLIDSIQGANLSVGQAAKFGSEYQLRATVQLGDQLAKTKVNCCLLPIATLLGGILSLVAGR